jgi:hypothetical protein
MTPEQEQGERLRAALARSVRAHAPSPAPVDRILAAGRRRRARRRGAVTAAVAAVLTVGLTVPLSRLGHDAPAPQSPAVTTTARPSPSATVPTQPATSLATADAGHGLVDGQSWSVTLEYHPTLPKGYQEILPPSMAQSPKHTSLLCQRMVIGGVQIDQQAGPWADCTPVNGPHDGQIGAYGGGLRGLNDKQGVPGSRLFVGATTMPDVAYGTVVLTNGQVLTGHVATIPHTGYRGWAVAIPNHRTMASFNLYDAHHHRLAHQPWH